MKYRRLGALDELHAVSLLLFISENEEVNAQDLQHEIGSYYAAKSLAESLRNDGLVDIETIDKPRVRITYRLTERGKKVAEKLKEIDKILEE